MATCPQPPPADAGFAVTRFDNRDTGRSTRVSTAGVGPSYRQPDQRRFGAVVRAATDVATANVMRIPWVWLIHAAGLRNCAAAVRPQTWCADGPAGLRRPGAGRGVVGLPVMMSRSFTAVGA